MDNERNNKTKMFILKWVDCQENGFSCLRETRFGGQSPLNVSKRIAFVRLDETINKKQEIERTERMIE